MPGDQLNPLPLPVPSAPTVRSPYEWGLLPDSEKAARLAEWQSFWLGRSTPAVSGNSGGASIVESTPRVTFDDSQSTANWKQAPTPEERQGWDDFNRY
jgi:hypothetical protein